MFILPWDAHFEVGIPPIDEQHQQIFIKANSFAMKCDSQCSYREAMDALCFLEHYAMKHFKVEESYMITSGYPEAMTHQAKHKSLEFKLKQITVMGSSHALSKEELAESVLRFLSDWLCVHIQVDDMAFGIYWREKEQQL